MQPWPRHASSRPQDLDGGHEAARRPCRPHPPAPPLPLLPDPQTHLPASLPLPTSSQPRPPRQGLRRRPPARIQLRSPRPLLVAPRRGLPHPGLLRPRPPGPAPPPSLPRQPAHQTVQRRVLAARLHPRDCGGSCEGRHGLEGGRCRVRALLRDAICGDGARVGRQGRFPQEGRERRLQAAAGGRRPRHRPPRMAEVRRPRSHLCPDRLY
uniref:Uncharacterized protein n=1 Tax=Arundo donax TaxID=35708 RepID=A0A0A8XT18_ARUDO